MMANRFNKKTRKREKQLKKAKQLVVVSYNFYIYDSDIGENEIVTTKCSLKWLFFTLFQKKKKKNKAPNYNFSALHLIHDPQGAMIFISHHAYFFFSFFFFSAMLKLSLEIN